MCCRLADLSFWYLCFFVGLIVRVLFVIYWLFVICGFVAWYFSGFAVVCLFSGVGFWVWGLYFVILLLVVVFDV